MNQNWKNFLIDNHALSDSDTPDLALSQSALSGSSIYPVTHLGILSVTGSDARQLLQGQITCNIDDITNTQAGIGAFCNPKGRVITTFFIVQQDQELLLLIPTELLVALHKRLQMFVFRSDVKIEDKSDQYCLLGMQLENQDKSPLPDQALQSQTAPGGGLIFKYPAGHYWLILGTEQQVIKYWQDMSAQGVQSQTAESSLLHNISAKIPWINSNTTELFIPQSINLDDLGGISFKKGCYTGQEIVARTHYLGKSKNIMVRAQTAVNAPVLPGDKLFNLESESKQSIGNVVNVVDTEDQCEMLVVIKDALRSSQNLGLADASPIKILVL